MALSQSALSELLDAMRAGGSLDVMREAMTLVLQELMEAEAAQAIGAAFTARSVWSDIGREAARTPGPG
jgi:putative transposase